MKKVLLTGATGFIGSHIARMLLERGYEAAVIKRANSNTGRIDDILDRLALYQLDITNAEAIAEAFADVFISSGEHKVGVSRQLALEETDQPALLFVDGDVEVARSPDPIVGAVSKRYPCVRGRVWQLISGRFSRAHQWGVGFGLTAIDTGIAREVGGFPPLAGGEDSAFCLALKDHDAGAHARG